MLATLIVWTWPALLVAALLLGRAWRVERRRRCAAVERADLELRARILAAWERKQEAAQRAALEARYNQEVARWAALTLLAYQAAPTQQHMAGYRQAMIDYSEAMQLAATDLVA